MATDAYTTPKNGEDRDVVLSRKLRAELWLWRRRQRQEAFARGQERPTLVFASREGTAFDDSRFRKHFQKLVEKAELRRRTPHAMRHTYISLLLQNGEFLAFVQKQAGHKSMDITLNVYGQFIPGGNREAVDRLDDEVQPKPAVRAKPTAA